MHDWRAELRRGARDFAGAGRIDGMSFVGVTFRKIDGRVGGGADHHVRPCRFQRSKDRGRLQQIKLGPTQRNDFDARQPDHAPAARARPGLANR